MEYELYLMHWGIKGQRWGIRKYQNADGSLTPAGRARYGKGEGSGSKAKTAAKIAGGVAAAGAAGAVGYAAYKKNNRIDKSDESWLFDNSNSNRAKEIAKAAIEPTIKNGKDRPNISPAQKIGSSAADIYTVANKAHNIRKYGRPAKQMSDAELRARINRLDLEKRYEQLAAEDVERGKVSANDIISVAGNVLTIGMVTYMLLKKK